ncbi:MAG: LysR family transcriptional regulator [Curvibacter sp.]|nr:LysR family transcriptional regulator [Curvibacter sp.]
MESKWLEDFLSLAETRSFSRAAEERHLTQSALSRRIRALEAWLGVTLVDRSVIPAQLTPVGWLFRSLAADILHSIYAARTLVSGRESLAGDPQAVQFAVAHTLVFTFFPDWLKGLHERYGQVSAGVQAVNVPEGVQMLVEGHCDLLLGFHHAQSPIVLDPIRFPFLTLGEEEIRPFSVPDAQGRPRFALPGHPQAPLPFMAYSSGAFLGNVVERLLLNSPQRSALQRRFESHMSEALKAMVVAGHGVGWLPASCVARELREGLLVPAGDERWSTRLDIRLHASVENQGPASRQLWNYLSGLQPASRGG